MTAENPAFGPVKTCPECGRTLVADKSIPGAMVCPVCVSEGEGLRVEEVTKRYQKMLGVNAAETSIPPLDQHLKSLTIEKTRIGKVYDFLLGEFIGQTFMPRIDPASIETAAEAISSCEKNLTLAVWLHCEKALQLLALTEAYHDLPNRRRLVELVEKAMGKEAGK